jgi:hypothetical protein
LIKSIDSIPETWMEKILDASTNSYEHEAFEAELDFEQES